MAEQRPLLTVQEVAALLGCSISLVWRMRRRGQFPEPMRVGTKWTRWKRVDVEAWLAGKTEDQEAEAQAHA